MTTIQSASSTASALPNVLSSSSARFDDNPFLALLVAEMRTQTPLEPVDNAAFMNQMAQFSSMKEQKQLNDNLLKLLDFQGALARLEGLSQSSALLGKEITFLVDGERTETGIVESVFVDDQGEVKMKVGDHEVGLRQVTGIRNRDGATGGGDDRTRA
jgi:flagellar basal-body rod modification protein FlgD